MNNIYKIINEKTSGKYERVRFPSVAFTSVATVKVLCKPEDREFVIANKNELMSLISEACAFNTPIKLDIADEQPAVGSLRSDIVKFTEKFAYVASIVHTISVETEPKLTVKIQMFDAMYDLAKNDYIPRLSEYLKNNYIDEVKLEIIKAEFSKNGGVAEAGKNGYAVTDVKPILGSLIPQTARSISSITEKAFNAVVCGVFAMPTAFSSKGGRKYERFLLYDGQTSLQCRFSPEGGASLATPELLNKTVCVLGNVEYDSARNESSMSVRELSECKAEGLAAVPRRPEPKKYERVTPETYAEYVQSSMFDGNLDLPPALKGSFVVFDFETTGLSILYDRPTELGAVKIVDGKITECFSTLIDPKRPIPEEVAKKTGITDEMVKGQPLFEDILPDFYKFSYGCSFVCHNIAFDFPYLLKGGNTNGWAFGDRKTYDTMAIAPLALPGIPKLSLDKVLEGLGLVNDNAHRALSDAIATAKAFIAMHRLLDNKDKNI